MKKKELLVVGGGPAGITLAKKLGGKIDMAVVRPEDYSMIYCAMPYAIEGLIEDCKTFKKDELVTDTGSDLIRNTVESIDFDQKKVVFSDGEQVEYGKLVLATGAEPFIPPVPGSDLKGVMGFKTQKDLARIMDLCGKGLKRAVVVGAGAIGIELAQALQIKGVKVSLVDMGASILPNLADSEMVEFPTESLARAGIHLVLNARVSALHGHDYVEHVDLDNGERIHLDPQDECSLGTDPLQNSLVVFAVGVRAATKMLDGSGIALGRDGILVNARMETNLPDVYACGDCVEFKSAISGETVGGKLATNAVPMAKVLAANLLGGNEEYEGFYNGAATKVQDWYIGGTGFTEASARQRGFDPLIGHGETSTQFPIMPDAKALRVKLVADDSNLRIIGGQIVSGEPVTGRIDLITYAIQTRSTLDDLRRLSYSAQPYQSFYPAGNAVVMAAENALSRRT